MDGTENDSTWSLGLAAWLVLLLGAGVAGGLLVTSVGAVAQSGWQGLLPLGFVLLWLVAASFMMPRRVELRDGELVLSYLNGRTPRLRAGTVEVQPHGASLRVVPRKGSGVVLIAPVVLFPMAYAGGKTMTDALRTWARVD